MDIIQIKTKENIHAKIFMVMAVDVPATILRN
jgi:hypothetical protein